MPLSNEAKDLLTQITGAAVGGVAGAAVGGSGGAAAGLAAGFQGGEQVVANAKQRRAAQEAQLQQAEIAKAAVREKNIATQLKLLDQEGLSNDTKAALTENIAASTGLTPADLHVSYARNQKAGDLITVLNDPDVPEHIRREAWSAISEEYGLDLGEVDFNKASDMFDQDNMKKWYDAMTDRDENGRIKDIDSAMRFLFSGGPGGKPWTGPQLESLGLLEDSPLAMDQKMELLKLRTRLNSQLTPKDVFGLAGAVYTQQLILGRDTMTSEQLVAMMESMMKFADLVNGFDAKAKGPEQRSPGERSPEHMSNMVLIQEQIQGGDITSMEQITEIASQFNMTLGPKENELFKKWFNEKAGVAEGNQ